MPGDAPFTFEDAIALVEDGFGAKVIAAHGYNERDRSFRRHGTTRPC
jgi:hypothetical protein